MKHRPATLIRIAAGAILVVLGLKLVPVKNIPIRVLIIEKAEKTPTEG